MAISGCDTHVPRRFYVNAHVLLLGMTSDHLATQAINQLSHP